jgi:N-acetylglutamate synthase-like GNAT family acetyltransferase
MNVTIRSALPGDLAWINERYRAIDFVQSTAKDLGVVAEVDGKRAGLGRIVPLAARIGELGGMVVFDEFRGMGLAKRIIRVLAATPDFDFLYCLPFGHLESLYGGIGFRRLNDSAAVPDAVLEKYRWCQEFYPEPVLLMGRQSGAASLTGACT